VFVVAHLGKGNVAAKVLFESESVRRNPAPSRETGKGTATNVAPSLTASNDPSRSPQSSEVTQQVNAVLEAVAETLMASDYKGPGHNRDHNFITEPVIIDRAAFNQGQNAQYKPRIEHGETMDSLVARGPHAVAFQTSELRLTGKLTEQTINPADRMAVRRLTPRECERLQGFNDDHTMIPWRNKPADQCPDGPRYKALGNSMAVPCMAWIGKRIDSVDRENRKDNK